VITTLVITALFVIPAGFLIVIGDQVDPLEEAKRISRKTARSSDDRTQLRVRLEELGRGGEKDYEEFRIKQYGYSAASAALAFALLLTLSGSLLLAGFGSILSILILSLIHI
jgi:hypothetical protein